MLSPEHVLSKVMFMHPLYTQRLKETGILQVLTVCFHQPLIFEKAGMFGIMLLRTI